MIVQPIQIHQNHHTRLKNMVIQPEIGCLISVVFNTQCSGRHVNDSLPEWYIPCTHWKAKNVVVDECQNTSFVHTKQKHDKRIQ